MSATYKQPVLPIADPQAFGAVHTAIETAFSQARLVSFLKSIESKGLRVRHFEQILGKGLLGPQAAQEYAKLANPDQGQIREFYLASLERISPEVREKFFKLYAYY